MLLHQHYLEITHLHQLPWHNTTVELFQIKNIQWKTPVKFVPNNPFTLASRNYLFLLFCFVKIEHFLNNFNQISEQLSSVCGCTSSQLWSQDTLIISQPFSSRRSNTCLAQPINHHPAVLHQRLCGYQPQARESKNNLNHGQHCEKWLDCWLTPSYDFFSWWSPTDNTLISQSEMMMKILPFFTKLTWTWLDPDLG